MVLVPFVESVKVFVVVPVVFPDWKVKLEEAVPAVKELRLANESVNVPPRPPREISPPPEMERVPLDIVIEEPGFVDSVTKFWIVCAFPPKFITAVPRLVKFKVPFERLLPDPSKILTALSAPDPATVVFPEYVFAPLIVKFPLVKVRFPEPVIGPSKTMAESVSKFQKLIFDPVEICMFLFAANVVVKLPRSWKSVFDPEKDKFPPPKFPAC